MQRKSREKVKMWKGQFGTKSREETKENNGKQNTQEI